MIKDPKKVVDAAGEKRVDWDAEVERGHLVDASGQPGRPAVDKTGYHVQGVPLTEAEHARRVIPAKLAQEITETRRDPRDGPAPRTGVTAPRGGWPRFGPDGTIIREEDAP